MLTLGQLHMSVLGTGARSAIVKAGPMFSQETVHDEMMGDIRNSIQLFSNFWAALPVSAQC